MATINGRTLVVEELLTHGISGELAQPLADRHLFQERVARDEARYGFLPGQTPVGDADGHRTTVSAIRRMTKAGDRVTPELFVRLLDERREDVKALFSKLGVVYEQTDAELVLTILRRQAVTTMATGVLAPQPRWLKYGSRVLMSLIEQPAADRDAILDGIFGDRQTPAARLATAADQEARARPGKALRAHDFVYDVPHALATAG